MGSKEVSEVCHWSSAAFRTDSPQVFMFLFTLGDLTPKLQGRIKASGDSNNSQEEG